MDAVKYLKERSRICRTVRICDKCPLRDPYSTVCVVDAEESVRIVEEWSKAHPRQTNNDKFKEVFGKEPIYILRDIANDYGEWLYAPYEAPKEDSDGKE